MAGFERDARRAVRAGRPGVAARRRLRRGRAHAPVGDARPATRVVGHRPRGPRDPGRVGEAPGAEPRVPDHEGREPARSPTTSSTLATAIEVLEHVPDPEHTVAEMARVRPRRPPARLRPARAALARAQHGPRRLPEATSATRPGHLNHWSKRGVRRAAVQARRGRRGALAVPVDDAARPCCSAERRAAGASATAAARGPVDRHRLDRARHLRLLLGRLARPRRRRVRAISLLWSVLFVIVSVIYRPIEQLLSRTIADRRARGLRARPSAAHAAAAPGRLRGAFLVVALAPARPDPGRPLRRLVGALLDPRRRRARLRGVATSPAAGSPGTSASASTAGSCSSRPCRGCCSPSRSRSGSPRGRRRSRSAWRPRRSCRSSSCRSRSRGGRAPAARRRARGDDLGARRAAGASRVAVLAIMLAEQTLLNAAVLTVDADGRRRGGRRLRLQRPADRARAAAALPGHPGLAAPPPRRPRGDATGRDEFRRAIRVTLLAIAGFAARGRRSGCSSLGPWAMDLLFDDGCELRALGPRPRRARHGRST